MIFWIVLALIVLGPFVLGLITHLYVSNAELGLTTGVGISVLLVIVSVIGFPIAAAVAPANTYTTVSRPLYALSNGSSVSGRFFLGSGYVDQSLTYTYIMQDKDGGYELQTLDASGVEVYQGNYQPKYVQKFGTVKAGLWFPWDIVDTNETDSFRVPTGTVDSSYNVDVNK